MWTWLPEYEVIVNVCVVLLAILLWDEMMKKKEASLTKTHSWQGKATLLLLAENYKWDEMKSAAAEAWSHQGHYYKVIIYSVGMHISTKLNGEVLSSHHLNLIVVVALRMMHFIYPSSSSWLGLVAGNIYMQIDRQTWRIDCIRWFNNDEIVVLFSVNVCKVETDFTENELRFTCRS